MHLVFKKYLKVPLAIFFLIDDFLKIVMPVSIRSVIYVILPLHHNNGFERLKKKIKLE